MVFELKQTTKPIDPQWAYKFCKEISEFMLIRIVWYFGICIWLLVWIGFTFYFRDPLIAGAYTIGCYIWMLIPYFIFSTAAKDLKPMYFRSYKMRNVWWLETGFK
jgi:hypothetical protein